MKRNGAVYLCAIGGAGALAAQCIESARSLPLKIWAASLSNGWC